MKKGFLIVAVLSLVVALAACSSGTTAVPPDSISKSTAVSQSASGSAEKINITGFAFDPSSLTVKEGTTVTWTNNDPTIHTVTSDTGAFDSGDLAQGATFSFTFTTAGTYVYHCTPHHARMSGTVVVTK